MAKAKENTAVVAASTAAEPVDLSKPNVRFGEIEVAFGEQERALAQQMGVDVDVAVAIRLERAVMACNHAVRLMTEAGLLLTSVKSSIGQERFLALLDEHGLAPQRANELMRGAAFVARLPADQRDQVLALHKTKVLALAYADPKVVQAMLEDGEVDLDLIGVRALRARIKELEAGAVDLAVQRDTAEADAQGLRKQLDRKPGDRNDAVPMVVADLRAEIMAQGKKADLAIDAYHAIGADVMQIIGTEQAHGWADATLRLAVAQLAALRLQLDGVLAKFVKALPDESPAPVERSYLTQQEMTEAAQRFAELTQVHDYEAKLREWERAQARPRGKGRPMAKPEAPGGAA